MSFLSRSTPPAAETHQLILFSPAAVLTVRKAVEAFRHRQQARCPAHISAEMHGGGTLPKHNLPRLLAFCFLNSTLCVITIISLGSSSRPGLLRRCRFGVILSFYTQISLIVQLMSLLLQPIVLGRCWLLCPRNNIWYACCGSASCFVKTVTFCSYGGRRLDCP